jgi:UPF0755 protein
MNDRKVKRSRRIANNGFVEFGHAFITLIMIGIVIIAGVVVWALTVFSSSGPSTSEQAFFVQRDTGLSTVAALLEEQGLITDRTLFSLVGQWVFRKAGDLKPGEFVIPAGASMGDILRELTEGTPIPRFVMVNPGEESELVAAKINDPALKLSGDPVKVPAEGSVLPVRHDYSPGDNRDALLERMQAEMTAAVDAAWEKCRPDVCGDDQPIKSKADLVTFASLIEEETGIAEERPKVASVFLNRLRDGERLQTDPTILYGLFRGKPQASRVITQSQLDTETPYNTYFITGLPPTPISNPGVASLEAAANPEETNFKYMVAKQPGDYTKGHAFAETLDEHNANVAEYRALERQAAEEPAPQ